MIYIFIILVLYVLMGYGFGIYIFGTNKQAKWSYRTLEEELYFSKENILVFNILSWMWLPMIILFMVRDVHYRFKRKGHGLWK